MEDKKMKNVRLGENKLNYFRSLQICFCILIATTATAFADITDAGQNAGEWFLSQIWWIALAVVAYMFLRFLVKKAWVPAGVFFLIGSLLLAIIKYPERLSTIGDAVYNLLIQ